jgi:hypothetical protein
MAAEYRLTIDMIGLIPLERFAAGSMVSKAGGRSQARVCSAGSPTPDFEYARRPMVGRTFARSSGDRGREIK